MLFKKQYWRQISYAQWISMDDEIMKISLKTTNI